MHTKNHDLPVAVTLAVIGGKWKPIILWHLGNKIMRFSELSREITGITQKMLTSQLREMERDDLIARKVFAEVPPHVEYSITTHGKSLQDVLHSMCQWGEGHSKRKGRAPSKV